MSGLELKPHGDYGKLPFDQFLLVGKVSETFCVRVLTSSQEWWDHDPVSTVFKSFDKLPLEIQTAIQGLNHQYQLAKLKKVYIKSGLAIRKVKLTTPKNGLWRW